MSLVPKKNIARDAEICCLYKGTPETPGLTLLELAVIFGVTPERIRQVTQKGGLDKTSRVMIEDGREKFLGVNVTVKIKKAIKAEAKKRGMSVSSLTSSTLKRMLEDLGYNDLGAA